MRHRFVLFHAELFEQWFDRTGEGRQQCIFERQVKQAHVKRNEAASGAITLIQRFGSAANLKMQPLAWTDARWRLSDELSLVPTPGHSPGHVCIDLKSRGERALFTGALIDGAVEGRLLDSPKQFAQAIHVDMPTDGFKLQ